VSRLPRAHRGLARSWWALVTVRSLLPGLLIIATGTRVAAVSVGSTPGLVARPAGWHVDPDPGAEPGPRRGEHEPGRRVGTDLHERLLRAAIEPDGIAHLEEPELADDFALAREFDLGIIAPPDPGVHAVGLAGRQSRTLGLVTELPIGDTAAMVGAAHDAAERGHVVYLTDSSGQRLAAIVPARIAAAGTAAVEALEDAADLEAARRAATEPGPNSPHADVLADLAEDEARPRRSA